MQHRGARRIDRRTVTWVLTAAACALALRGPWAPFTAATTVSAQETRALKDLVPNGWLIGVAINQNQSDARDTVAVDLITRQFNAISPENLLKFESVQRQPGLFTFEAQDRYVAFGRDRGIAVIGHTLV